MRLVVDAGPVIALSKTGYLDLLPALFDEVVAPAAVLDEVAAPGDARPGCEIRDRAWAVARSVPTSERIELQRASDIAAGEAEAILLAAEAPDSTLLLVDDGSRAASRKRAAFTRYEPARSWSPPRSGRSCSLRTSGARSRHFGRNTISTIELPRTFSRCSRVLGNVVRDPDEWMRAD
jgi:predicted nucleic acid-binding protein